MTINKGEKCYFYLKIRINLGNSISIIVTNAGKKFGREWIFRKISLEINSGEKIVVLGLNGSGKSTLLQALTGYLTLNEGELIYYNNHQKIEDEKQYNHISLASPYLELVEDFTLQEQIEHVAIYKPFLNSLTTENIIELSGLAAHKNNVFSC